MPTPTKFPEITKADVRMLTRLLYSACGLWYAYKATKTTGHEKTINVVRVYGCTILGTLTEILDHLDTNRDKKFNGR